MRCGTLHEALALKDRTFKCDGCGHVEDRDPVSGTGQALHAACGESRRLWTPERPGRRGSSTDG